MKFFGERDFGTRISPYFSRRMKARKILLLRRAPRHRKAQRQARAQAQSPEACWDGWSALGHWQFLVWVHFLLLAQSSLRWQLLGQAVW